MSGGDVYEWQYPEGMSGWVSAESTTCTQEVGPAGNTSAGRGHGVHGSCSHGREAAVLGETEPQWQQAE